MAKDLTACQKTYGTRRSQRFSPAELTAIRTHHAPYTMAFPKKQNALDWLTQYWNILLGRQLQPYHDDWLVGPIGRINENGDQFLDRLIKEQGLILDPGSAEDGLVESLSGWPTPIDPQIADFYQRTSAYDLTVHTSWKPLFLSLGYLVACLFSRRIQQLNLPRSSGGAPIPIKSEILKLRNREGKLEHTVWRRSIRQTGEPIFFGIYTTCRMPSGELSIKAIFPLPCGSATVIFRPEVDEDGSLELISAGKTFGDAGFYFIVEDSRNRLWGHYLPSFRETIFLLRNNTETLQAVHTLRLWRLKVYRMVYQITQTTRRPRP